ncbi:MAG: four helix bundle protein [Candidatus Aminicenantia bacterium]
MARDFTKIKAWQKADDLVMEIFDLIRSIPDNEGDYELKTEIKKSAIRIPVLIVRGAGRRGNTEFLAFLNKSMSAVKELEYLTHLANRLGYLKEEDYQKLTQQIEDTSKILFGFIRYFEKQLSSEKD